jgi:hypothetical protein
MIPVIRRPPTVGYLSGEISRMLPRDDFSTFFRENKALLREYVDIRTELLRLQGIRLLARSFSFLMVGVVVVLMALFILFFLGIAFAYWIASLTGSQIVGFLCAAALFLVVLVLFIALRRVLFQNPLIRLFIRESDSHADEDEEFGETRQP